MTRSSMVFEDGRVLPMLGVYGGKKGEVQSQNGGCLLEKPWKIVIST
jgi:hypothetical protein